MTFKMMSSSGLRFKQNNVIILIGGFLLLCIITWKKELTRKCN